MGLRYEATMRSIVYCPLGCCTDFCFAENVEHNVGSAIPEKGQFPEIDLEGELLIMEELFDFIRAALPWIAVGLLIAVFAARGARKKKKKEQTGDYGTEGMCLGMCLGTAIGTALGNNTGIGISIGMLIGLAIGTGIKKGNSGEDNDEKE